jgi:hypothetical protein
MKRRLVVALVLALASFAGASASSASPAGRLLGGYVQVVAYPSGEVRVCPDYGVALDAGSATPPDCSTGPAAVGVQTDALPNQSSNPDERWGFLYLVGTYDGGTFSVSSQSLHEPSGSNPPGSTFGKPPCRRLGSEWGVVHPPPVQFDTIRAYKRRYPNDITSVAMFDNGSVATIASTHPKRTFGALERAWPRQLCVVRSRYSLATIWRTRKRMVKLLELQGPAAALYGWISGAGGISCNERGEPTTPLDLLIETPALVAVLGRQPRGLVVLDATLHPVKS